MNSICTKQLNIHILVQVFSGLIKASQVASDAGIFAESRRDAITALAR